MDTLVFLRSGNRIPTEGDTKTKCGRESEGRTMQRLHDRVIHPIYSLQIPDTIINAHKYLLTRAGYTCHLQGYASA